MADLLVPGHHLRQKRKPTIFSRLGMPVLPVERQKEGIPARSVTRCISLHSGYTRGGYHHHHHLSLERKERKKERRKEFPIKNLVGFWPEAMDSVQKINPTGRLLTFHEIRQQFNLLSTKFM